MVDIKCVISDGKTGKSYQKVVSDDSLIGRKIRDKVPGNIAGLTGYELQITGGSDSAGFPMRQDIQGSGRKKILIDKGVGLRKSIKHTFLRKNIRGNTVSDFTAQVNLKITTHGSKPVEELLGIPPKEEKPAEAPAAK